MKTLKLIAIAICSLFIIGVQNSHAGSITYMYASTWDDLGAGGLATVYLSADEDILFIDWSVNGTYEKSTMHGNGTRSVGVDFPVTGHIKGKKYNIEATVSFVEPSDDVDSCTFHVSKPIIINGPGSNSGFYGSAEITRHYFNGTSFVMEASAFALNSTNEAQDVAAWFRQQKFLTNADGTAGGMIQIERDPHIDDPIEFEEVDAGETFSDSANSMMVEIWHGGPIGENETVWLDAHTHLKVASAPTDDWEADTGVHDFTEEDNPE